MMDTLDEAATPPVEWDQRLMPVKIRTPATPNERVMVGRALAVAKAELEHGQFGPWLAGVAPFSAGSARQYMREAAEHDRPAIERWEREQRGNHEAMMREVADALEAGGDLDLQVEVLPLAQSAERLEAPPATEILPPIPPIVGSRSYDRAKFAKTFPVKYREIDREMPPGCWQSVIGLMLSTELRVTVGDGVLALDREVLELRARLKALEDARTYLRRYPDDTPIWFAGESAAFHVQFSEGNAPYADALNAGDFEIIARHERVQHEVSLFQKTFGFHHDLPDGHPLLKATWPKDAGEERAALQMIAVVRKVLSEDADVHVPEAWARYGHSVDKLIGLLDDKNADAGYLGALARLAGDIAAAQASEVEDDDEARALFPVYVGIAAARVHDRVLAFLHHHPNQIPSEDDE